MIACAKAACRALFCALVILVPGEWVLAQSSPGVYDARVVVGQTLALTGPFADLSAELQKGSSAYFATVNAAGGVQGRRIEVVTKDDGYAADRAAANAAEFADSTFCLFTSFGTPPNEAIIPIAERTGMPVIAPYTGALSVRDPALRTIYNVRVSYSDEAEHLVRHLHTIGIRRIAIAYQNNNFGREILNGLTKAMTARQIEPLWIGAVETDASNASAMALKAVETRPEVVILGVAGKSTIEAIKTINGANRGVQVYALSILATPSNLRALGSFGRGVVISQVVPFPNASGASLVREYMEAMRKQGHTEVNHISLEGYLNAKVLVEGLRRSGRNLTRSGFHEALRGMRNYDAGGVRLSFDRGAASASSFVELTMVDRNGRLIK
jgi:branched-chain amino acid transport system substrate-binding protein